MTAPFDIHAVKPTILVGGPLPPGVEDTVDCVVIERTRTAPAMCEVHLFDHESTVLDNPQFRPGAAMVVTTEPASEDPATIETKPIFEGELVAIEASFSSAGANVVLRGYDAAHRLHRTRRTRTYIGQSETAIVREIAGGHGLAPEIDPVEGTSEYLIQRNQTDWEFLWERARELGFEVAVDAKKLRFRRVGQDPRTGPPQALTLGRNLLRFRPRATAAEQASSTIVRSINPIARTPVQGTAPTLVPENHPADPTLAPATIASAFGSTEDLDVTSALTRMPAAMSRARSRRQHTGGIAFEAEGQCQGNPSMKPGGAVDVSGVGARFSGTYTLSSVRHVFDMSGFTTHFTISGTHDRTLLGLTNPGAGIHPRGNGHPQIVGPVVGEVTDTDDPERLGRVKVKFAWLDDMAVSHWAPVVSPGAGPNRGLQVIPELHDQVLVVFAHGDARRPYVIGGLWSTRDEPPEPRAVIRGRTATQTLTTRTGHHLTFRDSPERESSVTVETSTGSRLFLADEPRRQLTIELAGGLGKISVDEAGAMTIEARQQVEIKTPGALKLQGAQVEITAGGTLTLQGPQVSIG